MTPEQERNYWILEGYPLMPEWIEFCRLYDNGYQVSDIADWEHRAAEYYGVDHAGSFDWQNDALCFVIPDAVTYHYAKGVDHAI